MLKFPHVTQTDNAISNDCGTACVAMYIDAYTGQRVTSAQLAREFGIENKTTTAGTLLTIMNRYGIGAVYQRPADLRWHREQWLRRRPTIALVSYRHMPKGPHWGSFAHWLVAVGETEAGILIHDPLHDEPYTVSAETFERAIAEPAPGNALGLQAIAPTEGVPMAGLGYNISAVNQDVANWHSLKGILAANPPASVVVLNDLGRARELQALLPRTQVIYRIVTATNHDDNAQDRPEWNDPKAFLARAIPEGDYNTAGNAGLWLYINNEPRDDEKTFTWLYNVAREIVARGWRAVLGNWSLGVPFETRWREPYAARLLEYVHQHSDRLQIGLHEYSPGHMAFEIAPNEYDVSKWPAQYPDRNTYVIGRFRWLVNYARSRGWFVPINITEWGTDRVPHLNTGGAYDWARQHWAGRGIHDHEPYWYSQLQWAWNALYKRYPEIRGVAYFCYGGLSSAAWSTFDVQHYPRFLALAANGDFSVQRRQETPPMATFTPIPTGKYIYRGASFNVRANAGIAFAVVTTLTDGAVIEVADTAPRTGSGYTWQPVRVNSVIGWVATSFPSFRDRLTPYVEPTPEPTPEPPTFDTDAIVQSLALLREARAALDTDMDRLIARATVIDTVIAYLDNALTQATTVTDTRKVAPVTDDAHPAAGEQAA